MRLTVPTLVLLIAPPPGTVGSRDGQARKAYRAVCRDVEDAHDGDGSRFTISLSAPGPVMFTLSLIESNTLVRLMVQVPLL